MSLGPKNDAAIALAKTLPNDPILVARALGMKMGADVYSTDDDLKAVMDELWSGAHVGYDFRAKGGLE